MNEAPESHRRIQGEMRGLSLLSGGHQRDAEAVPTEAKPKASTLLQAGELESYLQSHPLSARRIQGEVSNLSLLGQPRRAPQGVKPAAQLLLDRGELERY